MLLGMKLNHADLLVRDVPASVAYFETYFGLRLQTNANSKAIAVLNDGHGFVLVLQHADDPHYPEGFHLGFLVDDAQQVRALQARAKTDGLQVSDVIVNGRGTIAYFTAPEGYFVEVSCQKKSFA